MQWLEIFTLDDGSLVEFGQPTAADVESGGSLPSYRLRRCDGTSREFFTMVEVIAHLGRYDQSAVLLNPAAGTGIGRDLVPTSEGQRRSAMPSWVEQLAWSISCPTCWAEQNQPCIVEEQGAATVREFNHPTRNQQFHVREQERRDGTGPSGRARQRSVRN